MIEALARSPLFSAMDRALFERVRRLGMPMHCPRGQMLFQQGDPARHFFVITEGWVKLFRQSPAGEETVINVFSNGESFAEAAMFACGTYPVSGEAVADTHLVAFEARSFLAQMERQPAMSRAMLAAMARHLHAMVRDMEQMKGRSAPSRLAAYLLKLAGQESGSAQISLPFEKTLIAARLGMKPESLSRAVGKLRRQGVLTRGGQVQISDCARLAKFAS